MRQLPENLSNSLGLAIFSFEWGSYVAGLIGFVLLGVFAGLLRLTIQKLGCLGSVGVFGGFAVLIYLSTILGVMVPGVPWTWVSLAIGVVFVIVLAIALTLVKKKN